MKKLLYLFIVLTTALYAETYAPIENGKNIVSNNGYFASRVGDMPRPWFRYHVTDASIAGLSDRFSFEKSEKTLRLTGFPDKPASIQTIKFTLPERGTIELTVYAKTNDNSVATLGLFILGQKAYKWHNSRKVVQLNDQWKKYTLSAVVPPKQPEENFLVARLEIGANQTAFIGKVELVWRDETDVKNAFLNYPVNPALSRNLVYNPDFELGGFGWEQYFSSQSITHVTGEQLGKYYRSPLPQLMKGQGIDGGTALQIAPVVDLMSFDFSVAVGKKYTVSAWLKCATPGKKTECRLLLINNNMKFEQKQFDVGDQWRRYSFPATWKYASARGNALLRIATRGEFPLLVDRVQVEEGEISDFSAFPVQVGLIAGNNIFSVGSQAKMTLRTICQSDVKGKIKITIFDAWRKAVSNKEFPLETGDMPFPINTEKRGVFHVQLEAFNGADEKIGGGIARYAVLKDLSKMLLPDNPIAGHFEPERQFYAEGDVETPLLTKYIPMNRFNRSFWFYSPPHLQSALYPADFAGLAEHWKFSPSLTQVWAMFSGTIYFKRWFGETILEEEVVSPENLLKFKQIIRQIVSILKGKATHWELFNEPYGWRLDNGAKAGEFCMGAEKTAQLYQAAYEVIKEVSPEIKLVGPCVDLERYEYLERFLKAGGGKYIDLFTFHGYCGDADVFRVYEKIALFRQLLAKYNLQNLKIWNTEQYFGVRIPYKEQLEDEYTRDYFRNNGLDHAAAMLGNLVNHAAHGIPVASFSFHDTVWEGIGNERFLHDYLAAANCAAEFLGDAGGSGAPIEIGAVLRCFLFPKAKGGAIALLHALNVEDAGAMLTPDNVRAYDIMGNLLPKGKIRLGYDWVYLRFPEKESEKTAAATLRGIKLLGFGKPLAMKSTMNSNGNLRVSIENRLNQPLSGNISILSCPQGWVGGSEPQAFANLLAGQRTSLEFPFKKTSENPLDTHQFKLQVQCGNESFTEELSVSTLFVKSKDSSYIQLGAGNLSKTFDSEQKWNGANDLDVKLKLGWSAKGLTASIMVTDDDFCFTSSPAQSWRYDSLQFYFDQKGNGEEKDLVAYQISFDEKNTFAYLNKAPSGRFIGEQNQQTGIDTAVKVTCRKVGTHELQYEVFFPKETLPDVEFKAGTVFGFSFLANDNDGKGRKTGLTLAPKGTQPFGNPRAYRNLLLLP